MKILMMVLVFGLAGCGEGFVVNEDGVDDVAVIVSGNVEPVDIAVDVVDEVDITDEVTAIDDVDDVIVVVEVDDVVEVDEVVDVVIDDYDDCIVFNGVCAYVDKGEEGDYHCSDETKLTRSNITSGNSFNITTNKCNTIISVKLFSDSYMYENISSNTLIEVVKTIPAIEGDNKTVTIYYDYNGLVFYSNEAGVGGVIAVHKYSFMYGDFFITKENTITGDVRIIHSVQYPYHHILKDVLHEHVLNQLANTI